MNFNYIQDFHKERSTKIGASEIIMCIPSPEMASESLKSYTDNKGVRHPETAVDLYENKVNGKDYTYSFPATMGNRLEVFALQEFISDFISKDIAFEFARGYNLHKIEQEFKSHKSGKAEYINPEPYNNTAFKHNTQSTTTSSIAHADMIYIPDKKTMEMFKDKKGTYIINKNKLKIDMSKPFIVEAKTVNYFSFNARKKSKYKGYDISLSGHQGVPLAVYFQVQFQMALYGIDKAYVSLIYNTNSKAFWEIKPNLKHQKELLQIADYMKKCIDDRVYPKKLLMNSSDIKRLFPTVTEDFKQVKDTELSEILSCAMDFRTADRNEKAWKKKKMDAEERMSIHLTDTAMLKGIVNGEMMDLCKWKETGGGERLMGLGDIGKRDDSKRILNYMKKNDLIKTGNKNRKPSVIIKESDMEGLDEQNSN